MKKKFIKSICLLAAAVIALMPSCSKDKLAELNAPQNAVGFIIPENIFTNVILNMPRSNYAVIGGGMQYFSTYKEVPAVGDKYYSFNGATVDFGTATTGFYTNNLNRLYVLDNALTAADVNKKAIVRILKVYTYHQLTDVAGDVPYFDALKGESGLLSPKYDTQQAIYMDMLKELKESAELLNAANPTFTTGDLFYKGDISKWKKFAYTLMLRLGMRLSEVSPADAQTWVQTAIAGGVMTSDADIAKIIYANTTGNINAKTQGLVNGDYASPGGDNVEGGKYAATFIDRMKTTNDPRLPVVSVVWQPSGATYSANNTPAVQRGMVSASLNTRPTDFDTYSEPSQLVLNLAAPIIIMGPAEANLLLAEAALRGWSTGTSAATAYNNGVRSGMTQWALWPTVGVSSGVITTAQIDAYLLANPYVATASTEAQMEQINTQKWLSMFGDDYEVYANWRRTGYPRLKKVNYTGNVTGGFMFRRFALPISEKLVNADNYLAALSRQGFSESTDDNLLTKVWWDKKPGLPFNFN
ncbi:SusD/RagB family nutrient-binding outer membrane lipoprotein [Pedobacter hartonius]|uniref:Starch-binding associating with outer membrane n=1 Tax=Pedobacter hartonius TaxID=425514 RepID=A0A1H4GQY2_9SPHI|nr:SusD/RagB family nutrient-binding outer membrane lipoprotein [Pedobacter hartonius]SEB12069.1 Starch-binding associating with outer membrane [Pedobacter hartonius]